MRTASQVETGEWIVLDSGADVSLLPHRMAMAGKPKQMSGYVRLEDAQGGKLQIGGMNQAQISFIEAHSCRPDVGESECSVAEDFIVSDVKHILLSLGRLLKRDWKFVPDDQDHKTAGKLLSPDGLFDIPVHYRKNSLAIFGSVRCASDVSLVEPMAVRAAHGVTLSLNFSVNELRDGWQFMEDGTPTNASVEEPHFNASFDSLEVQNNGGQSW